jgi:hypothetical protein
LPLSCLSCLSCISCISCISNVSCIFCLLHLASCLSCRFASCLLDPASCPLPVACCLLPVACCLLPLASCLLPLASCLLPVACCLLPVACCLLPLICYLFLTLASQDLRWRGCSPPQYFLTALLVILFGLPACGKSYIGSLMQAHFGTPLNTILFRIHDSGRTVYTLTRHIARVSLLGRR